MHIKSLNVVFGRGMSNAQSLEVCLGRGFEIKPSDDGIASLFPAEFKLVAELMAVLNKYTAHLPKE